MSALRCLLFMMLGLCAATPTHAIELCVDTVGGLAFAINQFETAADGEVVTIKVVQGTYVVNDLLGIDEYFSDGRAVGFKLLGGYTAGCASRTLNPVNTVIDGNNQPRSSLELILSGDANAYVEGLTFTRMVAPFDEGGGALYLGTAIDETDVAYVAVRNCRFLRNTVPQAVHLDSAQMRFVNNLVADNTLPSDGAAVYIDYAYLADSGAAITNNTIANNHGVGLRVRSSTFEPSARTAEIANNILWGNDAADLHLSDFDSLANILFVNGNIIGDSVGTLPSGIGNTNSNPQFINAPTLNFAPALSSPAINNGITYQSYGIPDRDMVGNDRVIGSSIDRGAFESSVDDFTTAFVTNTADNGNNTTPTAGSLRAAIKAANSASGPYQIRFAISGACPRIINLTTTMLDITGKVTIDARTQNGWNANSSFGYFDASLCVVLNGSGFTQHAFRVPSLASSNASLTVLGMMFAGFTDAAIRLDNGRDHRIAGNQFGAVPFTSANGAAVRVSGASRGAFIGGYDDPSALNLIAGSSVAGVYLDNALGGSTVANNVIGLQPDGLSAGGNDIGVFVFNSPGNTVQYNFISHSAATGVTLSGAGSSGNLLQYNFIGFDRAFSFAGNQGAGVAAVFGARNNTIGAPSSNSFGGNLIGASSGPGVWISPSGGVGNRVLANRFLNNQNVDIDLANAGPSANQANNPATGPNNLQNFPLLTQAIRTSGSGASIITSGTLHSAPNNSYRIDLYLAGSCDASATGRGTAEHYLGRYTTQTNGNGDAAFSFGLPALPDVSLDQISATATSASGDTSELGNCIGVTAGSLPPLVFQNGFE